MDDIKTPNAEMGTPSMGVTNKDDKKEDKKEKKEKEPKKESRFVTKSRNGNKLKVTQPGEKNRAQRRASERRFLRELKSGSSKKNETKGAFGSTGK